VAYLTLLSDKAVVVLTQPLCKAMSDSLLTLDANDDVNVIVLSGNSKSFAAGADISQLNEFTTKKIILEDYFEHEWNRVLPKTVKPIIALVKGVCFGGGFELAMMCDMIFANEEAKFSLPEISLGIIPSSGGTVRFTRAVGKYKAMEYILTGKQMTAKEAEEMGIVNKVWPSQSIDSEVT